MGRPLRRHNFCANFLNYEMGFDTWDYRFCIVPVGDRSTILPSRPGKLYESATITFNAPLDAGTNPHTKIMNGNEINWVQRLFPSHPTQYSCYSNGPGFPLGLHVVESFHLRLVKANVPNPTWKRNLDQFA